MLNVMKKYCVFFYVMFLVRIFSDEKKSGGKLIKKASFFVILSYYKWTHKNPKNHEDLLNSSSKIWFQSWPILLKFLRKKNFFLIVNFYT